ncbi:early endosome antigen 1-like [Paramacrobiotus metropolitanus]|uniref:early endosome antigen 1-like n=1 Tax=Paramacrobiotus metropolitanus TaxID=2943436 RepID=UPI002445C776|nr:early endosome antigen 1-like [Paramacrobiotus metropolitanus]XP_055341183.1 early endosome antigen 1-like [Paramacrobiotus metropolitanus]
MQELSKLREAITYCDEQAALLHQQRKDLTDEIKQAEEQHKCDLDSAMKEYIFYRKEVDSFHEEADGSVVDLGQISAEVEQWKTTRNQWKSDQLAIEPEYYRLSAESQRLECKRSYLDRALLLIGKSIERMELAIGLCEEEYNESPIQKGVNQSALASAVLEKGYLTFQLQRLCQAALLRKSQLDDALTHRYLAEDDSHNMRNAVVHAERTYPVKGLSNTDAYASVAEQQLQLDRTSLQLILQQAEIVQLTAKEEKLLQKRAKLDKQQVDIIFKLDPESDFAVEGRRLHNNLDTAMDRYGSLQDDIFRTNNDVHQNTMALREREHHIEEAEIYITSLKTKILKEEEQIDNIKKRTTETFQTTVTDLRQQVQHLLRQAEQEFESNKPCKSILDLT